MSGARPVPYLGAVLVSMGRCSRLLTRGVSGLCVLGDLLSERGGVLDGLSPTEFDAAVAASVRRVKAMPREYGWRVAASWGLVSQAECQRRIAEPES